MLQKLKRDKCKNLCHFVNIAPAPCKVRAKGIFPARWLTLLELCPLVADVVAKEVTSMSPVGDVPCDRRLLRDRGLSV
jgi:hypothetical protein